MAKATPLDLNSVPHPFSYSPNDPDGEWSLPDHGEETRGPTSPDYRMRVLAHFRDMERDLCWQINHADAVVGCVAWLTSEPVLTSLAGRPSSIVVQKEDFLRPDHGGRWNDKLRALYAAVPGLRLDDPDLALTDLGALAGQSGVLGSIRCFGIRKDPRAGPASSVPRMHHKFFVFLRRMPQGHFAPYAVWTGSYNPTKNGKLSLENAISIHELPDEAPLATAYFREWEQVVAMSEPLDWTSEWVAPEWRNEA